MNTVKRVSDMTDQEVIAALQQWEAERDRLQRRLFAWVIWIIGSGFIAWVCVGAWLFSR